MFRLSFLILTTTTALLAVAAAATTEAAAAAAAAEQGEVLLHFLAPHPLAGLPVVVVNDANTVAAADMLGHYGKPPDACEGDEKAFQISGIPGMVCAPTCTAAGGCPTDLPDGVTARPQCALENRSTGDKYCVLICNAAADAADIAEIAADANLRGNNNNNHNNPANGGDRLTDGACGDATCQMVQAGLGICTYDV